MTYGYYEYRLREITSLLSYMGKQGCVDSEVRAELEEERDRILQELREKEDLPSKRKTSETDGEENCVMLNVNSNKAWKN